MSDMEKKNIAEGARRVISLEKKSINNKAQRVAYPDTLYDEEIYPKREEVVQSEYKIDLTKYAVTVTDDTEQQEVVAESPMNKWVQIIELTVVSALILVVLILLLKCFVPYAISLLVSITGKSIAIIIRDLLGLSFLSGIIVIVGRTANKEGKCNGSGEFKTGYGSYGTK